VAKKSVVADDSVMAIIRRITVRDSGELATLPPEKLDRRVYEGVAKMLEAAGGKWNRSRQGFVFPDNGALKAIGTMLQTGEVLDKKRTLEAFYTPHALIDKLLDKAGVTKGTRMLEPSAGDGRIADAAAKRGAKVACCEIDDERCNGSGLTLGLRDRYAVIGNDFLLVDPAKEKPHDAVVMNPPFSRGTDMRHVLHAMKFLRKGGVLVSIMSGNTPYAVGAAGTTNAKAFKAALSEGKYAWTELPDGTFKASGTMVKTVVLRFEK